MVRRPGPLEARHAPSLPTGPERPARPPDMTTATKVRLRFAKRGDLRQVSHHDLMRCLERMLRRARMPMATTQGFNPRPKMTFALALGLGIEARREVVDLELNEPMAPSDVLARLEACAPPGFVWVDARPLPSATAAPRPRSVAYELPVAEGCRAAARAALAEFLASASWPVIRRRADRQRQIDLRPHVLSADLADDGVLRFRLAVAPDGSARPEDLLEALALGHLLDEGVFLTRVDVELDA
jgi:radical SAM-linked protein